MAMKKMTRRFFLVGGVASGVSTAFLPHADAHHKPWHKPTTTSSSTTSTSTTTTTTVTPPASGWSVTPVAWDTLPNWDALVA